LVARCNDVISSIPHSATALTNITVHILEKTGAGMKFKYKNNFRYVIPTYTDPFRALIARKNISNCSDDYVEKQTTSPLFLVLWKST
jgi:hypothetical protein